MNKYDKKYKETQLRILKDLENIYGNLVDDLVVAASLAGISDKEYFLFKNHPAIKKKADDLINKVNVRLFLYVNNRTTEVWALSNEKNDTLVDQVFGKRNKVTPRAFKPHNGKALKTFRESKIKGLTLSDRVWNSNANLRNELESALNAAVSNGQSAKSLAKDIKKYLLDSNSRIRRVRDKFGDLRVSPKDLKFNPGRGVYRSSYQNALRLARNEINRAYREAEYLRFQQNPAVIGYRIQNSNRVATICPICTAMNGLVFPKTFKFSGFHVMCMCVTIPILCSDEEFDRILEDESYVPKQPEMPVIEL
ncbi:hypothetical protein D0T84_00865 [Dysgonomonas sp. 521]|uniref:hypothetical protein n=1 Tax=Dysgonomonas sp. 521 TaxID=2302932 RepID=UPI0013D2E569|nr:hypothetical protein [Dysgonomonas sp. 521]NDV93469.1 hypothetical protein [Dysgonomonas sp. 521]